MVIQFIFHPDILYSSWHFLKEVADYLTKHINSVKENFYKYRDHEFYTENYMDVQVPLVWSNEYIK